MTPGRSDEGARLAVVVRQLRRERGMSRAALAEAMGRSRWYVSNLEDGTRDPQLTTVMLIADGLGVRVHEIFARLDAQGEEISDGRLVALGRAVRCARRERDMSQEALAHAAHLAGKHISEIERANRDVRFTTLVQIAQGLDVPLTELVAIYELQRAGDN
jgi:transcriptional regulator with XRE-family HTH domain